MAGLRAEFPQLRICLNGDSLYACGEGFQIAKDYKCDYIYVFKPGRTPALWQDFQELLLLCPDQRVELTTPRGVRQVSSLGQRPELQGQRRPRVDPQRR